MSMERNKGIVYVLIAAVAFSLGGLLVKSISWSSPLAIAGGRCIFSTAILGLYIYFTKSKLIINKTTIVGAVIVSINMLIFILANKLTTAAMAIVLEYTAPIWIIIANIIFFKKKPALLEICSTLIVFFGIALFFIDGLKADNLIGCLVSLLGGVIYAFVIMLNDFKGGDSLSSAFMGHALTCLIGLPFVFMQTDFAVKTVACVIGLGTFQAGIGYICLAVGTKKCDSLTASLVASVEPILNPILVAIFCKEYLGKFALAGTGIVVLAIVIYNVIKINMEEDK